MKTKKMIFLCVLVAQSLLLFIIESLIPVPFIAPGAKLGLANIITVTALYTLSLKDTIMIIILRLLLSMFFGGNPVSLIYSAAGAALSLITMFMVKQLFKDKVSPIGVSCVGAVFHNIGQLSTFSLTSQTPEITLYLPVLTAVGIFTGFFVGTTSKYLIYHLKKLKLV